MVDDYFSEAEIVISQLWIEIFQQNLVLLIETEILKSRAAPNPKPEVKIRCSGRHLENKYNVITPLRMVRFG